MAEVLPKDVLLRVGGRTLHVTGYLAAMGAGGSYVEVKETFARADGATPLATFIDRDLTLRTAAADKVRIEYPSASYGLVDQFGYPICGPLFEGPRTNDLWPSEDLNHANWARTNCTISVNAIAGPDDQVTADGIITNAGTLNANCGRSPGTTPTNATQQSTFFKVKAGNKTWARVATQDKAGAVKNSWVNLSSGAIGTKDAGHDVRVRLEKNGFWRIDVFWPSGTGGANVVNYICPADGDNNNNTTGDGATVNIYVVGAQMEVDKAFAGSYMRTLTGVVSRAADSLILPFNFGVFDTTILARIARPLHADASGTLSSNDLYVYCLPNLEIPNKSFGLRFANTVRQFFTEVRSVAGANAAQAIPAGNQLTVCSQFKNLRTQPVASLDVGSGPSTGTGVVGDIGATFNSQTLAIGKGAPGLEMFGVLLDLIVGRGPRTLAEMLAIR